MNRPTLLNPATATPVVDTPDRGADPALLSRLVSAIEASITPGTRLSRGWLRALFEDAFGGPEGGHGWTWRLVQDCIEAAIARYSIAHPCKALNDDALALDAVLPVASHRSEQQLRLQQFSTPPSIAFLAAQAAALTQGYTVLEPSAGTDLLASAARQAGSRVLANDVGHYWAKQPG